MKTPKKSFPFTSLRLRNLRILQSLIKSLVSSKNYQEGSSSLSFYLPLLKKNDCTSIFPWLLRQDYTKFVTDKVHEYIHRLCFPEEAMAYNVFLKLQTSPLEALEIVKAVIII